MNCKFRIALVRFQETTMNELLQRLLDAATEAGGKVTYPQFFETLSYQEQQLMPKVIKLGKQNSTLKSYLVWDADNKENIHYLERVTP